MKESKSHVTAMYGRLQLLHSQSIDHPLPIQEFQKPYLQTLLEHLGQHRKNGNKPVVGELGGPPLL
jgi:hypothetical protein